MSIMREFNLTVLMVVMITILPNASISNATIHFDGWINQLNDDLLAIYQQAAEFAWEMSVNPTEIAANELRKFNANKSLWTNARCLEINNFLQIAQRHPLSSTNSNKTILNAAAHLLCNGPQFNEKQAKQLTNYLQRMQTTIVDTQICLPKQFDVCLNLDHIWEFTYVLGSANTFERLDFGVIQPTINEKSKLHLYDGYTSNGYYLNAAKENGRNVERILRTGEMICLGGEEEIDRIMKGNFDAFNRSDCALRYNEIFRWSWETWHLAVGNKIGQTYGNTIALMNAGAKANGYADIGSVWKEEVHLANLEPTINSLMQQIKPFYELLHGVMRNVLWKQIHKFEPFNKHSTIPAHMLGSMWSQNWQMYQKLILPFEEFNMDEAFDKLNWTSRAMAYRADDFYRSLNLPAMTKQFWQHSIFEKTVNFRNCHGTAANMYQPDDFRMIVCAESTFDDLSVIVHEMGHLQYYMAFAKQPPIFQDVNAALQESIGDAIFLGMITPHHLNRMNVLPDKFLPTNEPTKFTDSILSVIYSQTKSNKPANRMDEPNEPHYYDFLTVNGKPYPKIFKHNEKSSKPMNDNNNNNNNNQKKNRHKISDFDLSLLLRMALVKIPQIPFQYIMDAFRWNLFNKTILFDDANAYYWHLAMQKQGIHPPDWKDRRDYFDIGAKYHIADNTPFIRYFLASFIQAQIFEGLCKVTVFDTVHTHKPLPMPLHRCDIYGSKRAGNLLKKALSMGSSKYWMDILYMLTGSRQITADALLLYYKPLIVWLRDIVDKFDISTGW